MDHTAIWMLDCKTTIGRLRPLLSWMGFVMRAYSCLFGKLCYWWSVRRGCLVECMKCFAGDAPFGITGSLGGSRPNGGLGGFKALGTGFLSRSCWYSLMSLNGISFWLAFICLFIWMWSLYSVSSCDFNLMSLKHL
jgi:hypothetical protein